MPAGLSLADRLRRFSVRVAVNAGRPSNLPGELASANEFQTSLGFHGREVKVPINSEIASLASLTTLAALVGKTEAFASIALEDRVYLDTETTSLASGAGVLVFLVGIGRFVEGCFRVRQFLLRNVAEERMQLQSVANEVQGARGIVSFCGKSFDLPRLRDRGVYQGIPLGLEGLPHLDLHHAARRFYGQRLRDCRLQTLERSLLNVERKNDLGGAECPAAFFAYQRGEPHRMHEVLEHNFIDIHSLPRLEARLSRVFLTPDDGDLALRAGVLAADGGHLTLARDLLETGALTAELRRLAPRSICRAAMWLRRFARVDLALALLQHACERSMDAGLVKARNVLRERQARTLKAHP